MIFTIRNGTETLELEIDKALLGDAEAFFDRMDEDMSRGRRMGPVYVDNPDNHQRAQIAAQEIVTALDTENYPLLQMMVGYILFRNPACVGLVLDDNGDPNDHQLLYA